MTTSAKLDINQSKNQFDNVSDDDDLYPNDKDNDIISIQSVDSCVDNTNVSKFSCITYASTLQKVERLIQFVQNNKTYLTEISVLLDTLLEQARSGDSLSVHFDLGSNNWNSNNDNNPVCAQISTLPYASRQKRKQSGFEIGRQKKNQRNNCF